MGCTAAPPLWCATSATSATVCVCLCVCDCLCTSDPHGVPSQEMGIVFTHRRNTERRAHLTSMEYPHSSGFTTTTTTTTATTTTVRATSDKQ
uniref:Putative secreted protein n=1 Tax=Anopheles marajoara TaxID=58244 RepID=A0A2M4CA16_9DIPT